jgi:hypothetical protein
VPSRDGRREQIVEKQSEQLDTLNVAQAAEGRSVAAQPIRIMGFVDGDVIPPACYDKPYALDPDKHDGKAYDVLREVMTRTRKVGLASVVIEKKQALAAVIPIGRTLVLNVLRFASHLVPGKRNAATRAASAGAPRATAQLAQNDAPRRRPLVAVETPKTAARMSPVRKHGEVIDLAARRSSKRAQARPAKTVRARGATGPVATLHQLRRKSARNSVARQLA